MDRSAISHASSGRLTLAAFTRRVLVTMVLVALFYFVWVVKDAFLLLFGGIVLATILVRLSSFVTRLGIGRRWALWIVVFVIIGLLTGLGMFVFPAISGELGKLADSLPQIRDSLQESRLGSALLNRVQEMGGGSMRWGSLFSQVTGVASGVFNFFTSLFLILFITLFLAVSPGWYVNGVVDSFPKARRERINEVMHCAGEALWRWLIAQAFAMAVVGTLATIGMFVIGMRFALVLGLLAALSQFVPFVGPILWAIPSTLLALAEGPEMALKVLVVYLIVQALEGNLITPIVQKREAYIPPVVVLLSTVTFGIFFGPMGLILATPLTVVSLVFYQMLYRQDLLGDKVDPMGDAE